MTAREMVMEMITNRIISLESEIEVIKMSLSDKEAELERLTNAIEEMESKED